MPTSKVKKEDGFHCFYCNAIVDEQATRCPSCGRDFGTGAARPRASSAPIGSRIRRANEDRRRNYRLAIIVLLVAAVLLAIMFRPRAGRKPVYHRPDVPKPEFVVLETWDLPTKGVDRMSISVQADSGLSRDELQSVLDWVLYATIDQNNQQGTRRLQVVWAYVLDRADAKLTDWIAMAIWVDPGLPESRHPAGIGGDATRIGAVEYDFTNSVRRPEQGQGGGE
jgi:hypothetical protein